MSNKNEVFEYLIDQLRQQLPVVDVMGEIKRWSIDRSIAGRGNYTDEENAIIDAYIGLEHNPYKQQCEDLAHEVQSLKNQLRDASAMVTELQRDNIKKSEHISHLMGQSSAYRNDALRFQAQVEGLVKRLAIATGDVEAYKLACKGEHGPEQSGCRKDDTHGRGPGVAGRVQEGGVNVTGGQSECPHLWHYYDDHLVRCALCGLKRSDEES